MNLVEELRDKAFGVGCDGYTETKEVMNTAADRIERLEHEVQKNYDDMCKFQTKYVASDARVKELLCEKESLIKVLVTARNYAAWNAHDLRCYNVLDEAIDKVRYG